MGCWKLRVPEQKHRVRKIDGTTGNYEYLHLAKVEGLFVGKQKEM